MKFIILFQPGEAWIPDTSVFDQRLEEHGEYMQRLYDLGQLLLGGPYLDNMGGMAVIEVLDGSEASAILQQIPGRRRESVYGRAAPVSSRMQRQAYP